MNLELKERLTKILKIAYQEDWSDRSFSLIKAHVCVELSSILYEDVHDYELKKASRIHLIASDAYRNLIRSKKCTNLIDDLIGNEITIEEFPVRFFVVRGRYALVLGIYMPMTKPKGDVVILAVRGTVSTRLWDWKANLDKRKFYVPNTGSFGLAHSDHFYQRSFEIVNSSFGDENILNFNSITGNFIGDCFFHRGFFQSIVPHFASIDDELDKLNTKNHHRLVWTGHSLGGAMAAIGNALSHISVVEPYGFSCSGLGRGSIGAYTFGMPRYCGLGAVCSFTNPYHIYNKHDIVPSLPTRKMGFSDCSRTRNNRYRNRSPFGAHGRF